MPCLCYLGPDGVLKGQGKGGIPMPGWGWWQPCLPKGEGKGKGKGKGKGEDAEAGARADPIPFYRPSALSPPYQPPWWPEDHVYVARTPRFNFRRLPEGMDWRLWPELEVRWDVYEYEEVLGRPRSEQILCTPLRARLRQRPRPHSAPP